MTSGKPGNRNKTPPAPATATTAGGEKKQIPLRLSNKLYKEIAAWAEDEFRSVNGQIEYLLTECVRKRGKP